MGVPVLYAGSHYKPGVLVPIPTPPVPATLLLDLEADTLALSDGDPVSLWADQSGNGNDFTQTGAARPIYRANSGLPYVEFNTSSQWMLDGNFADNLDDFEVVFVHDTPENTDSTNQPVITKIGDIFIGQGWAIYSQDRDGLIQKTGGNDYVLRFLGGLHGHPALIIVNYHFTRTNIDAYMDGDPNNATQQTGGTVDTHTNSEPVRLNTSGFPEQDGYGGTNLRCVRIYSPGLSTIERATVTANLMTRYGVIP